VSLATGARSARGRSRLSAGARRAQLLESAVRTFLRRGYSAARVADLARDARVTRGTFYAHFESKRALLAAVARELADRLPSVAAPAAPLRTRDDLEAALFALHRGALEGFAASRGAALLLHGDGVAGEPSVSRALAAHDRAGKRAVAATLSAAKDAGLLRAGLSLPPAVDVVLGGVQRVVRTWVLPDERADVPALARTLARLHAAALSPDA
jgi:AcrR family transcriptional regulator